MFADLLEKARLIRQTPNERTFHIFYQLLNAPDDVKKNLYLDSGPDSFTYLSNGMVEVTGINELSAFEETRKAMTVMNIADEEMDGKLSYID